MLRYPLIKCAGASFFEIGRQYGQQAKVQIAHAIADYREVFAETSSMSWEEIQKVALSYVDITRRETPEVMEEVEGIAEGSGFSLADIMIVNCRYEITKFPKPKECTTAVVMPEAGKDGRMYLFKNWDYRVGIMDHVVIIHITEPNGTRMVGLAEAGQVLRGGMNSFGIGLACNNLQSIYDKWDVGLPSVFARRQMLKMGNFADAVNWLKTFPRAVSNNMMVCSFNEKLAADLEVYPEGTDVIEPEAGVLTHANHFIVQPQIYALPAKSQRDARLRELLMQERGNIDVDYIKLCMADHVNYPQALCRHAPDPKIRLAMRTTTVATEIYDYEAGMLHVCSGQPCCGEFRTIVL